MALKKNMELRRKIEEDYAGRLGTHSIVDSVISVGDRYRTFIEESTHRSEALSLL